MKEDNPEDIFKFVSSDARGSSPNLEDVLLLAEKVKEWDPIFSKDKERIVGYAGMINPFGGYDYLFQIENKMESFHVTMRDRDGILAEMDSLAAKPLFDQAKAMYQKAIDVAFLERSQKVKGLLSEYRS